MEDKHRGAEGGRKENQKPASRASARGMLCRARCRARCRLTEESVMMWSLKRSQNQLAESSPFDSLTGSRALRKFTDSGSLRSG